MLASLHFKHFFDLMAEYHIYLIQLTETLGQQILKTNNRIDDCYFNLLFDKYVIHTHIHFQSSQFLIFR